MIYLRANPTGIDIPIDYIQRNMYAIICARLGLSDSDWNCYDRCYRVDDSKGNYYPMRFAQGTEMPPITYNDNIKMTSFFDIGGDIKIVENRQNKARVMILFLANLDRIYPDGPGRADEELRIAIQQFLNTEPASFVLSEIRIGSKKCLDEYSGDLKKSMIAKQIDMQPKCILRMDGYIVYNVENVY